MLPRDRGTIVQVGSALAFRGIPLQSAYCASKHAIKGFTESLRTELRHDGSRVKVAMVHLPALNTPQFGWVRTRLPRHPQPVQPIYQPEVAALAIVWAAEHAPRSLSVGLSTVMTRLANPAATWAVDWYLSRAGVDGQQTDQPIDADRWRDNLDTPADDSDDHGAHGIFNDKAIAFSPQLWAATHKTLTATAVGLAAAALTVGRLTVPRR